MKVHMMGFSCKFLLALNLPRKSSSHPCYQPLVSYGKLTLLWIKSTKFILLLGVILGVLKVGIDKETSPCTAPREQVPTTHCHKKI